jgi:hypothetical protein
MKRATSLDSTLQYTPFLFEPLGDDRNGVPLVLASVLGRMSLDPWSEAASLAAMPAAAAARKLAGFFEAMPNDSLLRPQSDTLAERLVRLLPSKPIQAAVALEPLSEVAANERRPRFTYLFWIALACVLLVSTSFG